MRARAKKPRYIVHLSHLKRWKSVGYRIEILFLRRSSAQIAVRRIAARVRQGGHNVPTEDVLRRFDRGWTNFLKLIDHSLMGGRCMTTQGSLPCSSNNHNEEEEKNDCQRFAASVEPALKRAAKVARKTAKMYGTPLYFWKNGKVVAEKP